MTYKKSKTDVYQEITDLIVKQLEAGVVPWRKPWKGANGELAKNAKSGNTYQGINNIILNHLNDYTNPYWLTFKQCSDLGGKIIKGSKGMPVLFFKMLSKEREDSKGDTKEINIPLARKSTVFNAEQCDGLPDKYYPKVEPVIAFNPIGKAENVIAGYKFSPELKRESNENRAYYSPFHDSVNMPKANNFESKDAFYHTFFHELVHSTGHKTRLKRVGFDDFNPSHFGSTDYSKEELVAEIGACFLANHCHIEMDIKNSSSYIKSWMKALKSDNKLIAGASSQASKAVKHILGE